MSHRPIGTLPNGGIASPNSPNGLHHSYHPRPQIQNKQEKCTVFWDYENCPCPMSTKIGKVVYDIKRKIDNFLGRKVNKKFQLYCPMQRLHQKTREDATDLGILMMDVASKRKQESVDKRIIADIGIFAADLAETPNSMGHIVLVSGDSDYGYVLSRVRDRKYVGKIIMFINDFTKETLTCHADKTFCMFQSNLTRKENPFSEHNQRKIPQPTPIHRNSPYWKSNNLYNNTSSLNSSVYDRNATPIYNAQSQQAHSTWTTHYPSYIDNGYNGYNNNNQSPNTINLNNKEDVQISTKKHYLNGHRHSRSKSPNISYSNGSSLYKQPNNVSLSHKDEKDGDKNNNNNNNNKTAKGGQYVYKRKSKQHEKITNVMVTAAVLNGINGSKTKISAPSPIAPPKPTSIKKSSKSKTKTNGRHEVLAQEQLEQQLLKKQHTKNTKKKKKENKQINGLSRSEVDFSTNSTEFDGINHKNKHSSTHSAGHVQQINQSNDESKFVNKNDKNDKNGDVDESPLLPTKLTFDNNLNENKNGVLSSDFFAKMIAPKDDEMNKLFERFAPKWDYGEDLKQINKAAKINKNSDKIAMKQKQQLIDIKEIKSSSPAAPKKLIIKRKPNSSTSTAASSSISTTSTTSSTAATTQHDTNKKEQNHLQLKLVWESLTHCQKANNNNPRRREIYETMKKLHPKHMINKTMQYADECINTCLRYGAIEEMIKGRISSLYVLPLILGAIKEKEKTASPTLSASASAALHTNYIELNTLANYLKKRHQEMISYFSLQYLYRIISVADRVFTIHKEDAKLLKDINNSSNGIISDSKLTNIRFRVRKSAMQNQLRQQQQTPLNIQQQHQQYRSSYNNHANHNRSNHNYYQINNRYNHYNYY